VRGIGGICWTKPRLGVPFVLAIVAVFLLAGCGDGATTATSQAGSSLGPITREAPSGVVAGLVLKQPVSLDEARLLAGELGGDLIALYRTDHVCVQPITMGMPEWRPEPSRFAYFEAEKIRERRLAATNAGLSPPITGMHISVSYWEHWEDQWTQAQASGVRFEAVGIYLSEEALAAARSDSRFRAVEAIPHRRTDSLSPDYPGELLLESEAFPPGILTEPKPIDCTQ
jgi:hypothetical protein